jgi:hypothetical protein
VVKGREARVPVDEQSERPVGRMILFSELESRYDPVRYEPVTYLDLYLNEEGLLGRGYTLRSWGWFRADDPEERPVEAEGLRTVELKLDREAWNAVEERTPISEEQLPIFNQRIRSVQLFGEDAVLETERGEDDERPIVELTDFSVVQPDPTRRAYRGHFFSSPTGAQGFFLEEFGSPDVVLIILAIGFLIAVTALAFDRLQTTCFEQARKSCAPMGVASANSLGICTSEADPTGGSRFRFRAGCTFECKP